ncbi:MAG: hypothetical protein ABIK65_10870 [Candidatus Eisenbacteria bacterium]
MRIVRWILPLLALPLAARAAPAEGGDFFPVGEARRGMIGYGLTVFEGTRIDTFRVEVIDVMRGAGRTGDMILARVSGLGIEEGVVAQGMSGSPIYLDGRLAGALAFAYPYAKEPIAGITPIGEMLGILERQDLAEEASLGGVPGPSGPVMDGAPGPDPIGTPLAMAGFAPETARQVEEYFRPYGMTATAGGSGGSVGEGEWKALPGAAAGVRLLGGDATLAAVGTITWVDGERILAFGHPMFQAGTVRMPLVSVTVHTVVPSTYVSFKLGSPIETVGALVQDRRTGVAGVLGREAPTVPIDVTVESPGAGKKEYHYDALEDKRLTPVLASWAVANSILDREKRMGEATVHVRVRIDLEGAKDLEMENVFSSASVLREVSEEILLPLQVLAANSIARPAVKGVRVDVILSDERRLDRIEEIRLERALVRPGDEVRGAVTLRRYQGETETRRFALALPSDAPEGKLLLRVCDAASSEDWDSKRAPSRFAVKEIDRLVGMLEDLRTNDGIYVQLFSGAGGMTVNGREMPRLPDSRLSVIGAPLHDDDGAFVKGTVVASETIRTGGFVTGCKSLTLTVDRAAP